MNSQNALIKSNTLLWDPFPSTSCNGWKKHPLSFTHRTLLIMYQPVGNLPKMLLIFFKLLLWLPWYFLNFVTCYLCFEPLSDIKLCLLCSVGCSNEYSCHNHCWVLRCVCVCVLSGLKVYNSALALCPSPAELSITCRVPCSICSKWLLLCTKSHSGLVF